MSVKRGVQVYREVATQLLYCSIIEPSWSSLPNQIKHELCKMSRTNYKNIHDCAFYDNLRKTWERIRLQNAQDRCLAIECAICIDEHKLDGKDPVTTLMCGHSFCSSCIFRHIGTSNRPTCPMCRQCVFTDHAAQKRERETRLQEMEEEQRRTDLRSQEVKRNKRQHERFVKHQNKKQRKAEQVQQAEQVQPAEQQPKT